MSVFLSTFVLTERRFTKQKELGMMPSGIYLTCSFALVSFGSDYQLKG